MFGRQVWQRRRGRYLRAAIVSSLGAIGVSGAIASPANAHGAEVRIDGIEAYQLEATYDSGEPMAGAQVSVFHSDDPRTAVQTATTDEDGRWLWVADRPGSWTFQVRQAGHGSVINLEIDPANSATSPATTASASRSASAAAPPLPRWIAIASVIWGAVGTALFFARPALPDRIKSSASERQSAP